jgi:hypothetical protein
MTDLPKIQIDPNQPVDVEAVMRQIRTYIVARRNPAGLEPSVALPRFDGRLDAAIYEQLYHAALIHDQLNLSANAVPSRRPIVGWLMTLVRRKFHELVVYYVNQLAQKQITFNRHILGAVNGLVQEVEKLSPPDLADMSHDQKALRQQASEEEEQ